MGGLRAARRREAVLQHQERFTLAAHAGNHWLHCQGVRDLIFLQCYLSVLGSIVCCQWEAGRSA